MSDIAQLLPCPFCGGHPQIDDTDCGGSFIECAKCGASSAVHYGRKENLIPSWNRRKLEADEIERLRGAEQDAAAWVDERTKRLRADNERLRAALREIVEYERRFGIRDEGDGHALVTIARAALEGKDE